MFPFFCALDLRVTIHWPICSTWWMWCLMTAPCKYEGCLVSLPSLSWSLCLSWPLGDPVSSHLEELGSIRTNSRAQFSPLATGCLWEEKEVRFPLFSLAPSLPFSLAVSESTYLSHFHFAFFLPSLFISESFSFAPVSQSVSPLISCFPFLFVIRSFLLYFPRIPVSLTLLLDL